MQEFEDKPTTISQPQTGSGRANSAGLSETTPFDNQIHNRINAVKSQIGSGGGGVYNPAPSPAFGIEPPTKVHENLDDRTQVIQPEPLPGLAAFLYCRRGVRKGQFIQLTKERSEFGRANDCDIIVEDRAASAHHGTLRVENAQWRITDFDSTNGTLVNGKKLGSEANNPLVLADNDRIAIGETEYVFKCIED